MPLLGVEGFVAGGVLCCRLALAVGDAVQTAESVRVGRFPLAAI